MDSFLKKKYNQIQNINLTGFAGFQAPSYKSKPCFFQSNETEDSKKHLTLTKSGLWFDYTDRKEFNTITEWEPDMNNISFGYNRFDGRNSSIKLETLLNFLGYGQEDDLDDLIERAANLTLLLNQEVQVVMIADKNNMVYNQVFYK